MAAIIIADDQKSVRFTLGEILGDAGHTILMAETGEDALRLASEADLIVTDFAMPKMDGLELLKQVRAELEKHYLIALIKPALSVCFALLSLTTSLIPTLLIFVFTIFVPQLFSQRRILFFLCGFANLAGDDIVVTAIINIFRYTTCGGRGGC